jgi:peptidylprolyl isomerase
LKSSLIALVLACALGAGAAFVATKADAQQPQTAASNLENTLYMDLKDGRVVIRLRPDLAPKTAARIKELARQKFYDGVVFHRVIEGFMAQGGDPTGTGRGGSGKRLPDEFPQGANAYSRGVMAMANAGRGTSDSQFFIMLANYPLPPDYTIFAEVISGMEVVDKIKKGAPHENGSVTNPDKIIRLQVAADVKDQPAAAPAAAQ